MSAIHGLITNNKIVKASYMDQVSYYSKYSFDKIEHLEMNNVKFSCFHQHFTTESKSEILPYYDEKLNCMITLDAVIDNREELISLLNIKKESISDCEIILAAYSKWGTTYPKYIAGDFIIAIYDYNIESLILSRDHLGKRIIYFHYNSESFSFSTLMNPLVRNDIGLNDSFLKKYISSRMVINNMDAEETIYSDIKLLKPARTLIYNSEGVSEVKYWSLKKNKKYKDFDVAVSDFKLVFEEAVKCRLRTTGKVGIMLSGGLDSSAVACIAAKELSRESKDLLAYTSIASNKYEVNLHPRFIVDETEFVKPMKEKYPNIINNFLDCEGHNSYSVIDTVIDVMEEPVKFVENSYWLNELTRVASEDGCKIVLDGQCGNFVVSYGDIDRYLIHYLRSFKLGKFVSAFNKYCSENRVSRKKMVRYLFNKCINAKKDINLYFTSYDLLTEKEKHDLYKEVNRMRDLSGILKPVQKVFDGIENPVLMNQYAIAETKFGLKYNIIKRDPTRDFRVLECCYQFNIEIFNYNGGRRTLLREGMKGIVPDKILNNYLMGIQSGDFLHRLDKDYDKVLIELNEALDEVNELDKYIDKSKFKDFLDQNSSLNLDADLKEQVNLRDILSVLYCYRFLKQKNHK